MVRHHLLRGEALRLVPSPGPAPLRGVLSVVVLLLPVGVLPAGSPADLTHRLADTLPGVHTAAEQLRPALVAASSLRHDIEVLSPATTRDGPVRDLAGLHARSSEVVAALLSYAQHVEELAGEVRALRDEDRAALLRDRLDELTVTGVDRGFTVERLQHLGAELDATRGAVARVRDRLHDDVRRLNP